MKSITESFTPAEGITIENALEYLEAIEAAVRRDITKLPVSERSLMVGIVSGALIQTSATLNRFRTSLERKGEAIPVTDEQKLQLRLMIRNALAERKPES